LDLFFRDLKNSYSYLSIFNITPGKKYLIFIADF
jgi:hypothetical protein